MTQQQKRLFVLEVSGGGRVFSVNPDGSDKKVIVTGCRVPDGVAVDVEAGHVYWTNMGLPPVNEGSIERVGNTVNRAPMDATNGRREPPEILWTHLMEGIGIALDLGGGRMFVTDLGGNVYVADLDGSNRREILLAQGNLTGIAYAEVPAEES